MGSFSAPQLRNGMQAAGRDESADLHEKVRVQFAGRAQRRKMAVWGSLTGASVVLPYRAQDMMLSSWDVYARE